MIVPKHGIGPEFPQPPLGGLSGDRHDRDEPRGATEPGNEVRKGRVQSLRFQYHERGPESVDPIRDFVSDGAPPDIGQARELPLALCEPVRLTLDDDNDGK